MGTLASQIIYIILGGGIITLLTFLLTWKYIRTQKQEETTQLIIRTGAQAIEHKVATAEAIDKLLNQLADYAQRLAEKAEERVTEENDCREEKARLQGIIDSLQNSKKNL